MMLNSELFTNDAVLFVGANIFESTGAIGLRCNPPLTPMTITAIENKSLTNSFAISLFFPSVP